MTSKNKTSQPDNMPATEDASSDQKTLDAQAAEAVDTAGEKTDELEEVTDPIAADMAAADEDYIMEIVSPIFPGLGEDDEESEATPASDESSPENDADSTTDLEKIVNDAALTQDLSAVEARLKELEESTHEHSETEATEASVKNAADASSETSDDDATSIKDVADTFSSYLRSRRRALFRFVRRYSLLSGILALLSLALLSAVIVFFIRVSNVPSTDTVIADARTRAEAPAWTPGEYDADESLLLTGIEVVSRTRSTTAISSDAAQFGATGYANSVVRLTYTGNAIAATKISKLGYANTQGWNAIGDEETQSVSYQATSGVSTTKVLDAIGDVLAKLDEKNPNEAISYSSQFSGATFTVLDAGFDREQQTCWVRMSGVSPTFYGSLTCDITASFTFDASTGTWSLDTVSPSAGLKYDYNGLVGTWKGTFVSCEASSGSPCYAGRTNPLTLTVTSAGFSRDQLVLTGTAEGVVHNHGALNTSYRWYPGDTEFKNASVSLTTSGTIGDQIQVSGTVDVTNASLDAHSASSTSLSTAQKPQLKVTFDIADNSVVAQLISTHTENGQTVTFTDTYQLSKE
ncbi:hypothetical protein [Lancefieldella parvula]|uniref:hypothetical protein n=1 Tax=Lancefieldella parvula TaxID=1382 RepID=UPI0028D2CEBA|nr:hypothetical protein [Lancefieldella parvula]